MKGAVPPAGTVERWAWDLIVTTDVAHKLSPPAPPREWEPNAPERRIMAPGRPSGLLCRAGGFKTPSAAALRAKEKRIALFQTFLHHEVQAAELMGWAILAFPHAPIAMRKGLVGILQDELRHVRMYGDHIVALGGEPWGAQPVNDWFWQRVPTASSAAHFVATLGIGFEGGNLDHASRFAARLRASNDQRAAEIQEQVGEEEVPHVKFAIHWFRQLVGELDFDRWRAHLPAPLTPTVTRGHPLALETRRRAGFDAPFLARLASWSPGS